ncbi:hypothetical protein EG850_05725 [Gulosibacter macacae]|uniref:Uncharacterized protein n=1 Tax=Gulosibacter macacae TaxID=2488791 RepID=A0A3P3VXU6_9MICO|nr:hypothetical protein [Gulosibacter macacae]RRJ87304.1 hypothetical protein EG850_05725 [Gulosibacter macacae]
MTELVSGNNAGVTMLPAAPHVAPSLTGLSRIELEVMRLDGEVQRHGICGFEFYLPIGEAATAVDRAASLHSIAVHPRVVIGPTARWVHEGGPTPTEVHLGRRSNRLIADAPSNVQWHYRALAPDDVVELGGVLVERLEHPAELRGTR